MIVIIDENGGFQENISAIFQTLEEAVEGYGQFLAPFNVIECDDNPHICEGWTWDGSVWHKPTMEGCVWIIEENRFISHVEYRQLLHERTTNDTLEALRKIREGDTSIDWQTWLNTLDEYNLAIEQTKDSKDPVYPSYPIKP